MSAGLIFTAALAATTSALAYWAGRGSLIWYLTFWMVWIGLTIMAYGVAGLTRWTGRWINDARSPTQQ